MTKKDEHVSSSLHTVMDVDELHQPVLPHFFQEGQPDSIPRITRETLLEVLDGSYSGQYDQRMIIDCRFEYEFEGGHIDGAVNYNDKELLTSRLFEASLPGKRDPLNLSLRILCTPGRPLNGLVMSENRTVLLMPSNTRSSPTPKSIFSMEDIANSLLNIDLDAFLRITSRWTPRSMPTRVSERWDDFARGGTKLCRAQTFRLWTRADRRQSHSTGPLEDNWRRSSHGWNGLTHAGIRSRTEQACGLRIGPPALNLSLLALGTLCSIYWSHDPQHLRFGTRNSTRAPPLHLQSTGVCYLLWRSFGVHIAAAYFF